MKTLIISMTCGEGHNGIAKGIKAELDSRGEECKIVQLYGYSEKEVERQNKLFLGVSKFFPHIYNAVWERLRHRNINKNSKMMNGVYKSCAPHILKEILDYKPNNIITTHHYAGATVCYLKNLGKIDGIKAYAVVTDYCICPYWECSSNLNYVVLPLEEMREEIKSRGFKDKQILPFGFITDSKYSIELNKIETRKELNLPLNVFTVVLYSGGNCASSAIKLIKQLFKSKNKIEIVAICGKNKREYKKCTKFVQKHSLSNVKIEGFCTFLDKYFSCADVVFTRGGAGGISEQINKKVPFITREKLIINEKINAKLFETMGFSLSMKKLSDAPKIVDFLIENPEKLKEMKKKTESKSKPNATKDFIDFVLKNEV